MWNGIKEFVKKHLLSRKWMLVAVGGIALIVMSPKNTVEYCFTVTVVGLNAIVFQICDTYKDINKRDY